MPSKLLRTFQRFAPPVAWDTAKGLFGTRFRGNYADWSAAKRDCEGYDSGAILERVAEATRAVVSGSAAAERDGTTFSEIEYSWPILTSLLWIACQRDSRLSVLDFGGSLGSTYRQNRRFYGALKSLRWAVVEQAGFVERGKLEFEDGTLQFFNDLATASAAIEPDVVLLSGVLQYIEQPYKLLAAILALAPPFILFDRTPVLDGEDDRLTVQIVSKRVYPGSYPAWFFSSRRLNAQFAERYELVEQFESEDRANIPSRYLGMLWKRR